MLDFPSIAQAVYVVLRELAFLLRMPQLYESYKSLQRQSILAGFDPVTTTTSVVAQEASFLVVGRRSGRIDIHNITTMERVLVLNEGVCLKFTFCLSAFLRCFSFPLVSVEH
jgi:hypothetical protein